MGLARRHIHRKRSGQTPRTYADKSAQAERNSANTCAGSNPSNRYRANLRPYEKTHGHQGRQGGDSNGVPSAKCEPSA
jgi:hypothetical protein